jgi:gluconolactonase
VYEMAADGRVGDGTVFAELDRAFGKGSPDGMKTDSEGRVYVTGPGGVWILDAEGERLGILRTPIGVLNLCLGRNKLFLTAQTTLYRVEVKDSNH